MSEGLSNAGAGWPMYATLNDGDLSYGWTYAAAGVTLGRGLTSLDRQAARRFGAPS